MNLSRKTIIITSIGIIAIAALISVFVVNKSKVNKTEAIVKQLQNSVDLKIKGFVYTEVGAAGSKWEVKAETATYEKDQKIAELDKVNVKLVTSDGHVYEMSADKGQAMTQEKNIEIKGNVVVKSDNGDRFFTEYIKYSDAEKKFYTDAPVRMENKRMKITGNGLVIFMNKGELSIPSAVKAIINN